MAIELRPQTSAPQPPKGSQDITHLFGQRKISSNDRMFFTERLALLLSTGNSIHPSLEALRDQTDNLRIRAIIQALIDDVVSGTSFSAGLAKHPAMFSATYVTLIQASEQGGFMAQVLTQLQNMEEKRDRLNSTLISAFAYPIFLSVFSTAIILFILMVVFPKFSTLFASIHDQLPITTRILMAASDWARAYWYLMIIAPPAVLYPLARWLNSDGGRETIDQLTLRLPLVRDIFIQVYLVNFFRVMGLALANGVSVMDALISCREVINNRVFTRFITRLEHCVGEGKGLSQGFMEATFIPSMVRQTIRTGEQTGNLALVMGKIADFYDREIERKITMLSKMAEPVMLLVMGVVVGVIVSSLILPIFKLGRAVH